MVISAAAVRPRILSIDYRAFEISELATKSRRRAIRDGGSTGDKSDDVRRAEQSLSSISTRVVVVWMHRDRSVSKSDLRRLRAMAGVLNGLLLAPVDSRGGLSPSASWHVSPSDYLTCKSGSTISHQLADRRADPGLELRRAICDRIALDCNVHFVYIYTFVYGMPFYGSLETIR